MTPLARINHRDLADAAARRPPGYVAELMALAVATDETHVFLNRCDYAALREKYRGPTPPLATGPELWAELHAGPLTPELVASIAPRLPCGPCVDHWLAMLVRTPPDYSSAAAGRRWVDDRHNEVNALLGRAEWTREESDQRWGG